MDAVRKARLEKKQARDGQLATNEGETPQEDQPRVNRYEDIVKENALFEKYYKVEKNI